METTRYETIFRQFRPDEDGLSDSELLESFLLRKDQDAFGALMHRHGPMVLGVCRRVLSNESDAEDAFQATFFVLVHKAASIYPRGMVGNWLYGVAHNIAKKARAMNTKRLTKEREAVDRRKSETTSENEDWLQSLLDEELKALPDKYRVAIVLCELEGKTIKDAARQLGCSQGTIGTRLARGRKLLARRLARHHSTLSAGTLATLLAQNLSFANVPTTLMNSTIKEAALIPTGSATMSENVIALTEGMLKTMFLKKLKMMTTVLVLGMTLFGGGLFTYQYVAQAQSGQTERPTVAKEAIETAKEKSQVKEETKQKENNTAPKEFDAKLIDAWKKSEATIGWYGRNEFGSWQFFYEKPKGVIHIPALSLPKYEPGLIEKLPAPSVPFALIYSTERIIEREITDSGLKELAGLKNLQALVLGGSHLTGEGLKELVTLKNLQTLSLDGLQRVTDIGMKELARLESLQNLSIPFARNATNEGLKELAALKNLKNLDLHGTKLTDEGLKEFAALKNWQKLDLSATELTDTGVMELADLKNLEFLELGSTKVTDTGLKVIGGLKNLKYLVLTGTKVTDEGLKELAELKNLQYLGLIATQVTDAGLKEVAGFKNLSSLYVSGPQITDAGLKELAALKNLRVLGLYDAPGVTNEGVAQLRKVHRNIAIIGRR